MTTDIRNEVYILASEYADMPSGGGAAALGGLCGAAIRGLRLSLKPEYTEDDCGEAFISAAACLAAANYLECLGDGGNVESFTAGELSVRYSEGERKKKIEGLRTLAQVYMYGYTQDTELFFRGVQG